MTESTAAERVAAQLKAIEVAARLLREHQDDLPAVSVSISRYFAPSLTIHPDTDYQERRAPFEGWRAALGLDAQPEKRADETDEMDDAVTLTATGVIDGVTVKLRATIYEQADA